MATNSYKTCRYYLPKELGRIDNCLMMAEGCNHFGSSCVYYKRHTAETRKELKKAIEMKQRINRYKDEHKNGNTNN